MRYYDSVIPPISNAPFCRCRCARKRPFASAQSVVYFFPSDEVIFSCTIISYNCENPSELSFLFRSLQYRRGLLLPVRISTTSIMAKYHFCFDSLHSVRICLLSNSFMLLIIFIMLRTQKYSFLRTL